MKLTEQQLAQIFQSSTNQSVQTVNVAECLSAPNVAAAETIVSDFNSAQAAKLAVHMQTWSQQVAHDIQQAQRPSWSARAKAIFSQWRPDSPVAISALAVVFTVTAVVFLSNHQSPPAVSTDMVTNDVINTLPFESNDNDRLSQGGFDGPAKEDRLFDANFS
ncbi:MAG: hypothetical protein DWP95_00725 [Proteobacteria bacterium]|nr:MAG: hypothetical protein DWP95_00725 [Pseudomonadota bacterium]